MKGIDTLRDNPSGNPLYHIAECTVSEHGDMFEERLLHIYIEIIRKIDCFSDIPGAFDKAFAGFCCAGKFEGEIETVNQDKMADRGFCPGSLCSEYGDNEGIVSTIPSISTTLPGVDVLRSALPRSKKVLWLVTGGEVKNETGGGQIL